MNNPKNDVEAMLKKFRQGEASVSETRSLAAEIGNRHIESGANDLVELLNHDDELVRYNAAMSLGFELHYQPATDRLIAMLECDVDADCRDVAAGALRTIWQNSKKWQVLASLGKAALADADEDVRKAAFLALLIVNGVSQEQHLEFLTHGQRPQVDVDRVKAILAENSR
jgi:HEAT repeat protein